MGLSEERSIEGVRGAGPYEARKIFHEFYRKSVDMSIFSNFLKLLMIYFGQILAMIMQIKIPFLRTSLKETSKLVKC